MKAKDILRVELRPMFGAERHVWLSAVLFVIGLFAFEWMLFPDSFRTATSGLSNEADVVGLSIYGLYLVASVYLVVVFVLAAISSRWRYRVIYLALFGFALLAEYSYQTALGRFTNYYDIIAALSATGEQKSDSILAFLNPIAIVPIGGLVAISIVYRKVARPFGWKMLLGICGVSAVFFVHLSMVKNNLFGREFPNNSFVTFLGTLSDFAVQTPLVHLGPVVREEVPAVANAPKPTNNVIVIFDESIRADHLSLNGYERDTTPFLSELAKKKLLLNWGTAVAAATSSHPSYDAFISGARPEELERLDQRQLNSRPTLFQYAKAMGYRTVMIDGQMMDYWGGTVDDLNYIDDFRPLSVVDRPDRVEDWERPDRKVTDESQRNEGLRQWEIDERIAQMVNEIFTSSTGNFVFVYKRGCHFPYEKNFPPDHAIWKPVYHFKTHYEIPPADQVQGVVNSYDNSLKYNLDEFFKKLATDYAELPNNTVIIYTGDHGESFYANGRAGHGGETLGEAGVPLLVLGLKAVEPDTSFAASHHNIFATVLDLMNYPREQRPPSLSVSLLTATKNDSVPRYFNPLPGKKIRFDQ